MKTVELPEARWSDKTTTPPSVAVLREPWELTKRQERASQSALADYAPVLTKSRAIALALVRRREARQADPAADVEVPVLTGEERELAFSVTNTAIVTYLEEWRLERPLPTIDTVDDLPQPIYDALAVAATALLVAPKPTFETSGDRAKDEGSPS